MRSIASLTSYGISQYMKDAAGVAEYDATPEVLVLIWQLVGPHIPTTSESHHMLWWLYIYKHHLTKGPLQKALGVLAPTSRKAVKPFKESFLHIRNDVVRTKPCWYRCWQFFRSLHSPFVCRCCCCLFTRFDTKTALIMIKEGHARSTMMVWISSASTNRIQC